MANSMVYISFLLSSVFLLSSHVLTHEQFKGLILLILIIFVRGRNELMFGLIVFLARQKISTTPPLLHHTLHQLKWITILTHLHSITMAVLYQKHFSCVCLQRQDTETGTQRHKICLADEI
ncbi:uncharacterized protein LOC110264782 isoform X7 [Arachis ipaensis]|uniref:uncharacterized protein LOC110264782 isoform X7 n=1 Tax=Arachis ipaensis TaxID=130454 RepID=UPI000A2AFDBC|nr:uncharacterized protein LOC110264782 isoform X7 [Arachis ipaensis]